MKKYLLFCGCSCNSYGGWDDFRNDFDTIEQIKKYVQKNRKKTECDWVQIVDTTTKKVTINASADDMIQEEIDNIHNKAMDFAEEAMVAQHEKKNNVKELYKKSYDLELQAVKLIESMDLEPSRSVLFRSCAWLACDCNLYQEAQKLAKKGLSGEPDSVIKEELEQVIRVAMVLEDLSILAPITHNKYKKQIMKTTTQEELSTLKEKIIKEISCKIQGG